MRIGIIGAGISGLGTALALREGGHEVQLFEAEPRPGGHANTAHISHSGVDMAVDTGFIVYNERNYPNLTALFAHLGVETHWSDMSFGFTLDGGRLEWAGDNLDKILAQRWRVLDPRFLRMFRDVLRFNRLAPLALGDGRLAGKTLGEWLSAEGFGAGFRDHYLLPMGGAIWSSSTARVLDFPADAFVRFFINHDLLTGLGKAIQWRTVRGGSVSYVRKLVARLPDAVQLGVAVTRVARGAAGPLVHLADGRALGFDQVIIATHSDQALRLLAAPQPREAALLSAIRYADNTAWLHSDPALMPRRRKLWSSWNFLSAGAARDAQRPVAVTYWMNRLQDLDPTRPVFVTLNPQRPPAPDRVFGRYSYAHPQFDAAAIAAQAAFDQVQGQGGIWFAGAWLGYGFHEDGLRSGLRVAAALGATPVWARDLRGTIAPPLHEVAA